MPPALVLASPTIAPPALAQAQGGATGAFIAGQPRPAVQGGAEGDGRVTKQSRIALLATFAGLALAACPVLAQDAVDLDRLCRPGPMTVEALAEAFKAEGWLSAPPDTALLAHGLAMATPLLGDIDPSIIADAVPLAIAALPAAQAEVAAALHLRGPEGTALALLPVAPPDDGWLRVKCLAVFPPATTLQEATQSLANLSPPVGSPTIMTVTNSDDGMMGAVHVFVVRPEDYGWADVYPGGILQVIWRGVPAG